VFLKIEELDSIKKAAYGLYLKEIEPLKPFLDDKKVTNIFLDYDDTIFVERFGQGKFQANFSISAKKRMLIMTSLSTLNNRVLNERQTELSGTDPYKDCRVHGWIPDTCLYPTMTFRKPMSEKITLEDYVKEGRMTVTQKDLIIKAVKERKNIVISGGTSTGKTTLYNAILLALSILTPEDRLYIIEDTRELNYYSKDVVPVLGSPAFCLDLVRGALRESPKRIMFGELRYGDSTLELLKAWNTGHQGGMCTIHANDALSVISRLADLLGEVYKGFIPYRLIYEAVNVIIQLETKDNFGPFVSEIVEVNKKESKDENVVFERVA